MRNLFLLIFILLSQYSYAQLYGRIDCEWQPSDSIRRHYVRFDGVVQPEIWKRFPNADHILEISNGWMIGREDGAIVPGYIIFKYGNIDRTPSLNDALQLAYNYFSKHPDNCEYRHRDFIVVVFRVKKE